MQFKNIKAVSLVIICISALLLASPQLGFAQMKIVGEPQFLPGEIIADRDANRDVNGRLAAGLVITSELTGLTFRSNNGILKLLPRSGRNLLFLSPDERVVEVYKDGFNPLSINLNKLGVNLQSGKVWEIKLDGPETLNLQPVSFNIQPSNATLFIDGEEFSVDRTPFHTELSEGDHRIQIRKLRHIPLDRTITVSTGVINSFSFNLEETNPIAIRINSNPQGASIHLNDRIVGKTPGKLNIYPGKITLGLQKDGYMPLKKELTITEGENFTFNLISKDADGLKNYITAEVTERIKNWQQKGRYETTESYQQRVTEQKRKERIEELTSQLVDSLGQRLFDSKITKTNYDADNQVFEITFNNNTSIYLEVPVSEAPTFDQNLNRLRFSNMDFSLSNGNLSLRKAKIYNPANNKTYHYDSGQQVAFNTTQLAANFDPIDVNVEADGSGPNVKKGTREIEVGKADVDINVPETDMVNPDAIAVVIGNRNYQGDTPDVDYAINDARTVKEYLIKTLGFREGNILYRENASKSRMEVLLGDDRNQGRLADYLKSGRSDVFFFYSGHGAPDPNTETGYLMPVDADASALAITGYPLDVLYNNLSKLDAQSVSVVIDACFSGKAGGGEMLIQKASPIGIEVRNPAAKLKNGFVVTASSGSQVASWYPEKGHGLLTYFWLKGLQGAADLNEDSQLTTAELKQYLTDPLDGLPYFARKLHSRQQMPQVFGADARKVLVEHN